MKQSFFGDFLLTNPPSASADTSPFIKGVFSYPKNGILISRKWTKSLSNI